MTCFSLPLSFQSQIFVLTFALLSCTASLPFYAQSATPMDLEDRVTLAMPNALVTDVVDIYQELSGKRVVKDPKADTLTITIDTPGDLTKKEAKDYIEKSLLLAGFALIPSDNGMLKLIVMDQGRLPASEGAPVILNLSELPDGESVVTYLMSFEHISGEDAAKALQQIVPPHAYGKVSPVPNTRSVMITENSATIRTYNEIAKQIDLPAESTTIKNFTLLRSDPVEVAKQLEVLLGLGEAKGSAAEQGIAAVPPTAEASTDNAPALSNLASSSPQLLAKAPRIQPIQRSNSLVVIARPVDLLTIEPLIQMLDAETAKSRFVSRQLKYIDLTTFIQVAGKALQKNQPNSSQAAPVERPTSSSSLNNSSNFSSSSSGLGGGSAGGVGGDSFSGAGADLDITKRAESVLIGRTMVIVDPASSKFFASGPPDEMQMLMTLADELDVRPRQIFLSVIIGEFSLSDDMNFGLDWIRTLDQVGSKKNLLGGVLNTQGTIFKDVSKLNDAAALLPSLSGLSVYGQIGDHMSVFLHALEQTNRFKVIQKPTVTTLNHQTARIFIGQDLAIPGESLSTMGNLSDTASIRSTTQYIPVRLQLEVTPHIYSDNEVMLEFKQQNNDISNYTTISGNQVPNISTQGLQNTLIVPDRSTAMLGGLITTRARDNKTGLPLLVRIPVVKHLFGNKSKAQERRELIVFVQPHILPDEPSHFDAQERFGSSSLNYHETLQEANQGIPNLYPPESSAPPKKLK